MTVNHAAMKLGRKKPLERKLCRVLSFRKYLTLDLPNPPVDLDWSGANASYPMFANDQLGDCADAGLAHLYQAMAANAKNEYAVTQEEVIALYSAQAGYVPGDPSTDNGSDLLSLLDYVRKNPVLNAPELTAYVAVNPKDADEVKLAMFLFGGLYIGVDLPLTAQTQEVWSVNSTDPRTRRPNPNAAPGSWGGHCIPLLDYTADAFTCITWGARKLLTANFFSTYCDEAYALISPLWIEANDEAPSGFDFAQLQGDLAAVAEA